MLIAILSDTHGREPATTRALAEVRARGIRIVLHCGDVDEPETVRLFRGLDAHFVFGNCDLDREGIREAVENLGGTHHGDWGQLELGGRKIAFLHGDDSHLMRDVERSGHFDYLFYGHTHKAAEHRTGPTRVINPGALHRARPKTFIILDLESGALETIEVD